MWKRDAFSCGNTRQENHDSDQSISEEEGLNDDWIEHTTSFARPIDNKGGGQVLSRLEILTDSHKLLHTDEISITPHKRKTGFRVDDEVEDPLFNDGDDSTAHPIVTSVRQCSEGMIYLPTVASLSHSDEEIVCEDEEVNPFSVEQAKTTVGGTWTQASREVEAFGWLHKNSGCSSFRGHDVSLRESKSTKGGSRTKAKPKPLFHFQSRQRGLLSVGSFGNEKTPVDICSLQDEVAAAVPGDMNKAVAETRLSFQEEEYEELENIMLPSDLAKEHDSKEQSMAEFLDCFHERSVLQQRSLETDSSRRERRVETILEGKVSPSGDEDVDDDDYDDDLPKAINSGPATPSDDEILFLQEKPQNLKTAISRSMTDQFHEVLGTVSVIDEKPHFALPISSCSGLFGKLQKVMLKEKERDMSYLKSLSTEISSDDDRIRISVRILSKSLEGKLTVCSCTCIEENSKLENDLQTSVGRNLTIIFSPRICADVELEVGNLIHILPPWKEVPLKGKNEAIILCSYFSQIQS